MVGLIEACKGISELFPEVIGGEEQDRTGSRGGSMSTPVPPSVTAAAIISAADAYTQLQVLYCTRRIVLDNNPLLYLLVSIFICDY